MRYDYDSFVGKKFGKLTVEKVSKVDGKVFFYCKCDCGNHKLIDARNILRGLSRSCGCERSVASSKRRLPKETVDEIIRLRVSGMSFRQIATRLNISRNSAFAYSKKNEETIELLKAESWKE